MCVVCSVDDNIHTVNDADKFGVDRFSEMGFHSNRIVVISVDLFE